MELRCNLLSSLLENIDEDRRLTVFDAGSALPETVDFFSRFKCRLYFADLYSEDLLRQQHEEVFADKLEDQFAALLDFPKSTKFDICLLWDVFNYLDSPALRAFSKALNPFLHSGTGIHGFSTLRASTVLANQQFSIQRQDHLKVRPRTTKQLRYCPHPQAELKKLLYGFDVSKATLLSNGLLEMLLQPVECASLVNG